MIDISERAGVNHFAERQEALANQLEVAAKEAFPFWTVACDKADAVVAEERVNETARTLARLRDTNQAQFHLVSGDLTAAKVAATNINLRIREHEATIPGYLEAQGSLSHSLSELSEVADDSFNADDVVIQLVDSTKSKVRAQ